MFYISDNIFVCSHVLTRIVDKYVYITHHYRLSIGDFNYIYQTSLKSLKITD